MLFCCFSELTSQRITQVSEPIGELLRGVKEAVVAYVEPGSNSKSDCIMYLHCNTECVVQCAHNVYNYNVFKCFLEQYCY